MPTNGNGNDFPGWTDVTPGEFDRSGHKLEVLSGPHAGVYRLRSTVDAREIASALNDGKKLYRNDEDGSFGIAVPDAPEFEEKYPKDILSA
ncbi:MAG: hypothetical protein AAF533_11760 [Acidobacteriota bacterium]